MNAIPNTTDDGSKRWLKVLAVAAAASVIFLTYSFVRALSPAQPSVVAPQKPTPAPTEEAVTRTEPDWNGAAAAQVAEGTQAPVSRPDPFAAQNAAAAKNDPVVFRKAVHQQAEYLRKLIAEGKLPGGYGNLTKEQVDEMEKKGLLIE
jgi:hypothetical protein